MTSQQPRDVDMAAWLNKVSFHPADTELKQRGFAITRQAIANLGAMLGPLIPAGEDKSVMFRLLGEVLMYANRALAVGGGPVAEAGREEETLGVLADVLRQLEIEGDALEAWLKRDGRYEAQQLADPPPVDSRAMLGAVVTPPEETGGVADVADRHGPDYVHALDIADGNGGAVRVTARALGVEVQSFGGAHAAVFNDPNRLSLLLEAIAGAGNNAFNG